MNPINRSHATNATLETPDQLAALHDAARHEAICLRRQAIDNFWRSTGRWLGQLATNARNRGQGDMVNAR